MAPWNGTETADITYQDTEGDLTALLVNCRYLDGELWRGARPRYLIEVKSTTGPCGVPFYMSKGQYQMVSNKAFIYLSMLASRASITNANC